MNTALLEKRNRAIAAAQSIMETASTDGRVLTDDENRSFDAAMADADAIKGTLDRAERMETESRAQTESRGRRAADSTFSASQDTLRTWLLLGSDARPSADQLRSLESAGMNGKQYSVSLGEWSNRAQSTVGAAGGFAVAPDFAGEIDRALKAFGGVRNVARVIRSATGADLPWPTTDDTANSASIIAENAVFPVNSDIVFGSKTLKAYKYGTGEPLKVSLELLQDSAISIPELVGELLGERIGRGQNAHFTTGSGTGQPEGAVTASVLGVTAASATLITSDELLDLIHSLDPAYRKGAKFMLNDATLKVLRKLKGSDGQYVWQENARTGEPGTIFGYQYEVNQDMATAAVNARTVLFGQFSKFIVRDVKDITLVRLDERYAEYGQVAFTAIARADSRAINANAIKHLKQAAV